MVLILAGVPTLLLAPVMPFIWQTPDHLWLWLALIFIGAIFAIGAVADKTSILWNRVGDEATQAMARNS